MEKIDKLYDKLNNEFDNVKKKKNRVDVKKGIITTKVFYKKGEYKMASSLRMMAMIPIFTVGYGIAFSDSAHTMGTMILTVIVIGLIQLTQKSKIEETENKIKNLL